MEMSELCAYCKSNNATYVCSNCKVSRYCSRECQKQHWKQHKLQCTQIKQKIINNNQSQSIQVVSRSISCHLKECIEKKYSTIRYKDVVKGCEFLGRCLVAAKDFDSRDILFTEQAFATAIHRDNRSTACFNCTQLCKPSIFEKCSYCNSVFCSSECLAEGKNCHSLLCQVIHAIDNDSLKIQSSRKTTVYHHSTLLLAITIYLRFVSQSSTATLNRFSFQDFLCLCESPDQDQLQVTGLSTFSTIAKEDLISIIRKLMANEFSIFHSLKGYSGVGCYLISSFLNHSCSPNCTISYDNTTLRISALRPIKKGEVLTISYISNTSIMDPYVYINPQPFRCQCPLSLQYEKNEKIIEDYIQNRIKSISSLSITCPFYKHRLFYCKSCYERDHQQSKSLLLHSSREAYVCLKCKGIVRKGSMEFQRIQACQERIDVFVRSHQDGHYSLQDFITLFCDSELVQTFPYDCYCWSLPYLLACSSSTALNQKAEETVQFYLQIISNRFVTVDEKEPVTLNHMYSYAITIKQLFYLYKHCTSLSSGVQSLVKEKALCLLDMWASEVARAHLEDTEIGQEWKVLYDEVCVL